MPDQPNDTPPQPDADDQPNDTPPQRDSDDQTTEIHPAADSTAQAPTTAINAPAAASKKSWALQPLHVTRAVATGTAAGILLVGSVAGLAIGATLAGDDSDGRSPGRTGWHVEGGDRGEMPERGEGGWREQAPPPGLEQGGPGGYFGPNGPEVDGLPPESDESAPTDPSAGTT